jgi:hypothetical protein
MVCFLRAFALRGSGDAARPRRWLIGFAVSLAAMMYTHNWALFFALACGVTWLGLLWPRRGAERRALVRDGLLGLRRHAAALRAVDPDAALPGRPHGRAVVQAPDDRGARRDVRHMLGYIAQVALLLAAGAGVMALLERREGRRLEPRGTRPRSLIALGALTLLIAWLSSQASPAWAVRYLAVGAAAVVLLCAAGLAHAGASGSSGCVVVVLWVTTARRREEQRARDRRGDRAEPAPGDLVDLDRSRSSPGAALLPAAGLRYATVWGRCEDVGGQRLARRRRAARGSTPERDLEPLLDRCRRGSGSCSSRRSSTTRAAGRRRGPRSCARARSSGPTRARGPALRDRGDRADARSRRRDRIPCGRRSW